VTGGKTAQEYKEGTLKFPVSVFDRALVFAFVFAAALVVYLFTLCPTFASEDSPELTTAAWTLGVPHPPGYPVYVLCGKAVTTLVAFGTVAWRMNVASALAAACAAGVVALTALRLTRSRLAAVVAGMSLAFSENLWAQAVIAEVYALNSLVVALLVYLAVRWNESGERRLAVAAAGVVALGLGLHPITAFVALVIVVFAVLRRRELVFRPSVWLPALAVGAAVLVAEYGFTAWTSRRNPYIDWGDPETFGRLMAHVLRSQYSTSTVTSTFSVFQSLGQIGVILDYLLRQFGGWIGPLCVFGAVVSFRRAGRGLATALLGVLVVSTFSFMLITNFELDRAKINANEQFWLPANTILAVWLAIAADAFRRRARKRFKPRAAIALTAAVALLLCASPLWANWRKNDRSHYTLAEDYTENLLQTLPARAVLFMGKDINFGLLYKQGVEGKRPDVELFLANANASVPGSPYRDLKLQWHTPITEARLVELLRRIAARDPTRPLLFDKPQSALVEKAFGGSKTLRPFGMFFRVTEERDAGWVRESLAALDALSWRIDGRRVRLVPVSEYPFERDLAGDYMLATYHFMAGLTYYEAGPSEKALKYHREAIRWAEGIRMVPFNCALTAYRKGFRGAALEMAEAALRIDPEYENALSLRAQILRDLAEGSRSG